MKKLFTILSSLLLFAGIAQAQPGAIDPTFNTTVFTNSEGLLTMSLQTDGKIVVGRYLYFNGVANPGLIRYNADGSLDEGFNTGTDFSLGNDGVIYSTAIQADGKILVGADFNSYLNPNPQRGFTRLNTDGSTDASFNLPAEIQSARIVAARAITVQPDGKILAGVLFIIGNQSFERLYRLNTDGSADISFSGGYITPGGSVYYQKIVVQGDGKIIITGGFSSILGVSRNGIARLNADGTLDMSFDAGNSGPVIYNTCSRMAR